MQNFCGGKQSVSCECGSGEFSNLELFSLTAIRALSWATLRKPPHLTGYHLKE